jgi:succinate dehydrogenase / fumarate reductase flavoprotein subunit
VQRDLQEMMQRLVGIVRTAHEMSEALGHLSELRTRADAVGVTGNRDYNPGWHTALDLANLLDVSEAITRSAIERRESRGGHFREDCPAKVDEFGKVNVLVRRTDERTMAVERVPIPEMPGELRSVIDEMG